jgi:hypothetical protein
MVTRHHFGAIHAAERGARAPALGLAETRHIRSHGSIRLRDLIRIQLPGVRDLIATFRSVVPKASDKLLSWT